MITVTRMLIQIYNYGFTYGHLLFLCTFLLKLKNAQPCALHGSLRACTSLEVFSGVVSTLTQLFEYVRGNSAEFIKFLPDL